MKGRPAIYATFSSYDEVAHHSGLERDDTLEALRKLDQQFGRIERARRYAARPYEIVVLSDHGQTQGATFKQRNGYGLDELVQRNLAHGGVSALAGGDEQEAMVGHAAAEATGRKAKPSKSDVSGRGRRRPRLGQPRPRLPDGGGRPADARGARDAPSEAAAGTVARTRMSAGCSWRSGDARRSRARAARAPATSRRTAWTARTRSRASPPRRRGTSFAPTASSTRRTSSSAASTTRPSTRAAPSRS